MSAGEGRTVSSTPSRRPLRPPTKQLCISIASPRHRGNISWKVTLSGPSPVSCTTVREDRSARRTIAPHNGTLHDACLRGLHSKAILVPVESSCLGPKRVQRASPRRLLSM
jgi:hypothetical protein